MSLLKTVTSILLLLLNTLTVAALSFYEMKNQLEKKYDIKIYSQSFRASDYARQYAKWKTLTSSDQQKLTQYMKYFYEEWNKYSPSWVAASKLKAIYLVKNLIVMKQARAAMPDLQESSVYYDIGYSSSGEKYQRGVIHHEYFHIVQYFVMGRNFARNAKWKSFNLKSFRYGSGGASAYGKGDSHTVHPKLGFVNGYSTYGLAEDQAEIYAYLFLQENYDKIKRWSKTDIHLRKKVLYMEGFIFNNAYDMKTKLFYKKFPITASSNFDEDDESGGHH